MNTHVLCGVLALLGVASAGCSSSSSSGGGDGSDAASPGSGGTIGGGGSTGAGGAVGTGGSTGAGGGSSGSCASFTACGGDPTGTWTIGNICFSKNPYAQYCPTATTGMTGTGTLTLNADKTYTVNGTMALSIMIPASCLATLMMTDCSVMSSDSGTGLTCTGSAATGCTCAGKSGQPEAGTWSTSGTTITMKSSTSTSATPEDYCVSGNSLTISSSGMVMSLSK